MKVVDPNSVSADKIDASFACSCGCYPEMHEGPLCENIKESYCPAQCSGRGECMSGFCKCKVGWFGTDCARKKAGMEMERPDLASRPWIRQAVGQPPSASDDLLMAGEGAVGGNTSTLRSEMTAAKHKRRRPFIYIYDLPPDYNARLLQVDLLCCKGRFFILICLFSQYKLNDWACSWRLFRGDNSSTFNVMDNGYSIETYLHEAMLLSSHRTFDPLEADFFYVPVFVACLMWPVLGWADFPYYYAPDNEIRPMHAANIVLEVSK